MKNKDGIEKRDFNFFKFVIRMGFVAIVLEVIVGVLVGFGLYI